MSVLLRQFVWGLMREQHSGLLAKEGKRRAAALKGKGRDYGYYERNTGSGLGVLTGGYYSQDGVIRKGATYGGKGVSGKPGEKRIGKRTVRGGAGEQRYKSE